MENEHVIHGLRRKHGELAGRLREAEKLAQKLRADMTAIDAALLVFDPGAALDKIKRGRRNQPKGSATAALPAPY
jgi:hypothetical protein